jgi:signal transduction histidine kinase/ActR/RegA family two-component response regulator
MTQPRDRKPKQDETVSVATPAMNPLIDSGLLPALKPPVELESTTKFQQRMRHRVLVVVEQATLSGTLAQLLASQGIGSYEVTVATEAPDVMKRLKEPQWDAFVFDEASTGVLSWLNEGERVRVQRRTIVLTKLGAANPAILTCGAVLPVARLNRFSLDHALAQIIRHQVAKPSEPPPEESLYDVFLRLARTDLGRPQDVSDALRPLIEAAAGALRVGRVSVWQFVDSPKRLRCLAMLDTASRSLQAGLEVPAALCPVYCLSLHNHRIMAIEDAVRDQRTAELADLYLCANNIGALLDAPIYLDGQVVGLLCCAHIGGSRRWTEDEQRAAASFADYAQIVLAAHRRRLAEDELQAQRADLAQAKEIEALVRLAGGIAHDFNNLLTIISGRTEVLQRAIPALTRLVPQAASLEREVAPILTACERATSMVSQLAAFNRRGDRPRGPVSINKVIDDVCELLERTIDRRIAIERHLRARDVYVHGDETSLHRALLNLGLNARDAMPQGGTLSYSTEIVPRSSNPEVVEIRVIDTGHGIADAARERVLEPYFTTKATSGGTGLGLAIVNACIVEHGGELDFSSQVDVGTSFRIRLPVCAGKQPTTATLRKKQPVAGTGSVLLIESDHEVRETTARMLSFLGYHVHDCATPFTALKHFSENRFGVDLVLLDLATSEMPGKDCLRALKLIRPDVRCIMLGEDVGGLNVDYVALGALAVVRKPYSMAALIAAIEQGLRSPARIPTPAP